MLADIATGHTWGADVCFLLAVICAALATVLYALSSRPRETTGPADGSLTTLRSTPLAPVLASLSLFFIALGFLIL